MAVRNKLFGRKDSSVIPSLLTATLDELGTGLDNRQFTAVDLVTAYLQRIKEVDREFKSVIELNPDAIEIAKSLDDELEKSGRRSILHGIPLILKDNVVTGDKMECTSGSIALIGAKPAKESTVAAKLREAGAILLGKAALTEWANLRWTNASTGWSPRGGQCTGPFYPNMKASGSSTGSAVGTVLGLAFAGIGTETDGSIVSPAGRNSVVGLKPTTGLVSRDGVIPISFERDTVGVMANKVKDAASILSFIAGQSSSDTKTTDIPFSSIPNFSKICSEEPLNNVRIGIPRNGAVGIKDYEENAFQNALDILRASGAEIVDDTNFDGADKFYNLPKGVKQMTSLADYKVSLESYLASLATNPNNINTLCDLIEFTKSNEKEDYPRRNVQRWEDAEKIGPDLDDYVQFQNLLPCFQGEGGIDAAIAYHGVDLFVVPTAADPICTLSAIQGSPMVTVPLGFSPEDTPIEQDSKSDLIVNAPGFPFQIIFLGKRYEEAKILRVAHAFQVKHKLDIPGRLYRRPGTDLEHVIREKTQQEL